VPGLRITFVVALLAGSGCGTLGGPTGTMATVPREWRKVNPWSPQALEARDRGELKPLYYTEQMAAWQAWAKENLQDGDVLFRHGQSFTLKDRLNDAVQTGLSDSRFNHDSIVVRRGDEVWLYDAQQKPQNLRKLPFEFWMLETRPESLVVKRLKPEYRHCIPQALAYCEAAWRRQPTFDDALRLDDERLYCTEMIEKAYRSAGLALSDPVAPRCLPNYDRCLYRILGAIAELVTQYRMDEPVFAPGNTAFGTYSSPYLEVVCGDTSRERSKPPICPGSPFPPAGDPRLGRVGQTTDREGSTSCSGR
jgi:hypothetical protein